MKWSFLNHHHLLHTHKSHVPTSNVNLWDIVCCGYSILTKIVFIGAAVTATTASTAAASIVVVSLTSN